MECFRDLPKVNLHQHLEGAVRPETFLQLVKEYQVDLPIDTVEESRQYLQVSGTESSLADFLDKIHRIFAVSRFPGVLKRFAYEAVEDAYRQNVQYLEIRFIWILCNFGSTMKSIQCLHIIRVNFKIKNISISFNILWMN